MDVNSQGEPVSMSQVSDEPTEADLRRRKLEAGSKCGPRWPVLLIVANGWILMGCIPTYVALAVLEADAEPDFAKGLEVPRIAWAANTLLMLGTISGLFAGVAMARLSDHMTRKALAVQVGNCFVALVYVGLMIAAAILFPMTQFAKDNQWAVVVCELYVAYSVVQYVLWGCMSFAAFQLRHLFRDGRGMPEFPT